MTLLDIQKRNEHFLRRATTLVDMIPGAGLLDVSTALIRSARLIDKCFIRLLQSKTEDQFSRGMARIEEELDECVYLLDRVDIMNSTFKLKTIEEFLKEGYDLLSIYSLCCDQLISKRVSEDEEIA